MASITKMAIFMLLVGLLLPASGRQLPFQAAVATIEGGGGLMQCWEALWELRSCSAEIILFFLNRESYLGMGCCGAIRMITYNCWPSMLSSLGFTAEEGDILKGYCGAIVATPPESGDGGAVPPVGPTI
ncbi:Egg cell-secreted protein 1-3 [Nymphaea thermarum]|nr:Egg cell-secreted protein 1-3 [Nymphaea thermarum]